MAAFTEAVAAARRAVDRIPTRFGTPWEAEQGIQKAKEAFEKIVDALEALDSEKSTSAGAGQ